MKRRILFVDDEPNILKGLQRSLRLLRKYWDMAFVQGADNALKVLENRSFDVVVTDMRMPGIDGADLLKIVQDKYPMMVRIILSGHSDQGMIMETVKSAHQYLSKPCEKKVLVSVITRSCSLRDLLNEKPLQQLLGGIETMPSIPILYAQIMEALRSPDASAASVGRIISRDMGMTAKVLQLVNSSFFGMPGHISSAKEAVILLGIDVVKTLVLNIEVFSKFNRASLTIISIDEIHKHCVRTGIIAQKIARYENMDKEKSDNAMIASILHDLGKLLLVEHYADRYKHVMEMVQEEKIPVFQAEKNIFHVTHAEVGAYLLGLWGLPENVVEGIAFHHNPGKNITGEFALSGLVHVSELMEAHEKRQPGKWEKLDGLDEAYMEKLGLLDKIPLWRDCL